MLQYHKGKLLGIRAQSECRLITPLLRETCTVNSPEQGPCWPDVTGVRLSPVLTASPALLACHNWPPSSPRSRARFRNLIIFRCPDRRCRPPFPVRLGAGRAMFRLGCVIARGHAFVATATSMIMHHFINVLHHCVCSVVGSMAWDINRPSITREGCMGALIRPSRVSNIRRNRVINTAMSILTTTATVQKAPNGVSPRILHLRGSVEEAQVR